MANRFPIAGQCEHHINCCGGSVADKNKHHDRAPIDRRSGEEAVYTLGEEALQNVISLVSGGGNVLELADLVLVTQETGFEAPNNSSDVPQGGNNDVDVMITIDPPTEIEHASVDTAMSSRLLPRLLLTLALLTLIMDIGTMLYKPPRGVVFGHHRLFYYITLAGIFLAGVAEAGIACWIAGSHDAYRRHYSFGRIVLCASIGPLVAVLGICGFAFLQA